MKARILFVDDDALVLRALERTLRTLRGEWELNFARGGAEALGRLAEGAYDVVVTDLQMPGMNGVEFLSFVKQGFPTVMRIALSGEADPGTTRRCLEVAHQYLAKPCNPNLLRARIRSALTLGRRVPGECSEIAAGLVADLQRPPAISERVSEALASDRNGMVDLARVLGEDPDLTARLLQVANPRASSLEQRIADPLLAVSRLGRENIRSLVLARSFFDQVGPLGTRTLDLEHVWSHSVGVASGARIISTMEGATGPEADQAFAAGLLHDVGILVLASRFGPRYEEVVQGAIAEHVEVEEVEQRMFGTTHAEVGACLLAGWGLPEGVVAATGWHHNPSWSGETTFGSLTAVHSADVFGGGAGEHPVFERTFLDQHHLLAVRKKDRLHAWKQAMGPGAIEREELR